LTPQLLKSGVTNALITLLEPIQAEFQSSKEWQEIEKKAYPPPETKKKEKKVKDKGSKHPGAKAVEAKPDGHVEGAGKDQVNLSSGAEAAIQNLDIKSE
jgi:tyrosyl-tRNA synthetase